MKYLHQSLQFFNLLDACLQNFLLEESHGTRMTTLSKKRSASMEKSLKVLCKDEKRTHFVLKEGLSDGVTIVLLIGLIEKVVVFLVGFTRVIYDRESGRSRGFGFVTFNGSEDASAAIQALDGQELDGRRIRVNIANDRTRGYSGGGGGGGFGGGYGGGGGNYGSGGYGGGGNYGSGGYGGGGNYGGSGNYGGAGGVNANAASNYGSGENSFGFGTSGDSYATGNTDAASNSFGNSDQLGNDASSNQAEIGDVNSPVDAGENYGDDKVESSDYADRRA